MRRELVKKLQDKFWFIPKFNPLFPPDSGAEMYIDCDDGWFDLIHELCSKLKALVESKYPEFRDKKPGLQVAQIKEKLGGLRFYIGYGNDEIFDLIRKYEELSYQVCEVCGHKGKLRIKKDSHWYKTLCVACAKKLGYKRSSVEFTVHSRKPIFKNM